MGALSHETENVQNPALGAMVLWRFITGYSGGSGTQSPTPIPLLFIPLPLLLHEQTADLLSATRVKSGLRAFVAKFGESKTSKSDVVLAIHDWSLKLRALSFRSLELAVACRLVAIDEAKGAAIHLSRTPPNAGIGGSVKAMLKDAEKLGDWCSKLSLYEISSILKVRF